MKYPSAPGATYNGKFDNGIPGVRAASLDDANYMNAVYDEIINVITAAGIAPDENSLNQLLQAIQKLGPQFSDQQGVLSSGGWASIPLMVAGVKRSIVIQWGVQTVAGATTTTYSFPIAFPTQCLTIVASTGVPGSAGGVNADIVSASQYKLQNLYSGAESKRWIAIGC